MNGGGGSNYGSSSSSTDLVQACQKYVKFLQYMHMRNVSTSSKVGQARSLHRYRDLWLPMLLDEVLSRLQESPVKSDSIDHQGPGNPSSLTSPLFIAPPDVAWLWYCHRLMPRNYKAYIQDMLLERMTATTPEFNSHSNAISSPTHRARLQALAFDHLLQEPREPFALVINEVSMKRWSARFPQEPFFYVPCEPNVGITTAHGDKDSTTKNDPDIQIDTDTNIGSTHEDWEVLLEVSRCHSKLLWHVSDARYRDVKFLRYYVDCYYRFLYLKLQLQETAAVITTLPVSVINPSTSAITKSIENTNTDGISELESNVSSNLAHKTNAKETCTDEGLTTQRRGQAVVIPTTLVAQYPMVSLIPTLPIALVWDAHILSSMKLYDEDCLRMYGTQFDVGVTPEDGVHSLVASTNTAMLIDDNSYKSPEFHALLQYTAEQWQRLYDKVTSQSVDINFAQDSNNAIQRSNTTRNMKKKNMSLNNEYTSMSGPFRGEPPASYYNHPQRQAAAVASFAVLSSAAATAPSSSKSIPLKQPQRMLKERLSQANKVRQTKSFIEENQNNNAPDLYAGHDQGDVLLWKQSIDSSFATFVSADSEEGTGSNVRFTERITFGLLICITLSVVVMSGVLFVLTGWNDLHLGNVDFWLFLAAIITSLASLGYFRHCQLCIAMRHYRDRLENEEAGSNNDDMNHDVNEDRQCNMKKDETRRYSTRGRYENKISSGTRVHVDCEDGDHDSDSNPQHSDSMKTGVGDYVAMKDGHPRISSITSGNGREVC